MNRSEKVQAKRLRLDVQKLTVFHEKDVGAIHGDPGQLFCTNEHQRSFIESREKEYNLEILFHGVPLAQLPLAVSFSVSENALQAKSDKIRFAIEKNETSEDK